MTVDWLRDQLALAGALAPGTRVAARDPMEFPLVALSSGVRIDPLPPNVLLQPTQGGIVLRDRSEPISPAPEKHLALALTLADAANLGRKIWGAGAFLVSDGAVIEGVGTSVPETNRTALATTRDRLLRADPLTALRQSSLESEIGVLETGDSVVWMNPLVCIRGLGRMQALRVAVAGAADGALLPQMVLHLPCGRVRLEFEGVRARPDIKSPRGSAISWLAGRTAEIDNGASGESTTEISVRCNRARLVRIGLVIPARDAAPFAEQIDPLEVYADPISVDYLT